MTWADRALIVLLLDIIPKSRRAGLRLFVSPETVLRWRRDIVPRRWVRKSQHKHPGRPRTRRTIRALVLRMARENSGWGYRRIHGELAGLGILVAPSTVWEILITAGIPPAPRREGPTWAQFLHGQAEAILADFFTVDLLDVDLALQHPELMAQYQDLRRPPRLLTTRQAQPPKQPADHQETQSQTHDPRSSQDPARRPEAGAMSTDEVFGTHRLVPRSTITLSAFAMQDSWPRPERLQTISGTSVSTVLASHSPFGPHWPGHQVAVETRSSAPAARSRRAGSSL